MKSNFRNQIILLACIFALCSCEAVKDKLTVDVDLGSFSIVLDDIEVGDGDGVKSSIVRLDGDDLPYLIKDNRVLSSTTMPDLPANISEYEVVEIEIGSSCITVTSLDGNGTVVEDFLMIATGITPNFSIADYALGVAYCEADLENFVVDLLKKLIAGEVTLNTTGKTNVAPDEKLKVTIQLNLVRLKTKLLK